jgi:hypothetical protein
MPRSENALRDATSKRQVKGKVVIDCFRSINAQMIMLGQVRPPAIRFSLCCHF